MDQNSIITSLSYYLHKTFFEEQDPRIVHSRSLDGDKRPYFRVQNAMHQTQLKGSKGFIDHHVWYIWYFGETESLSRYTADYLVQKINTERKIQGYLFEYNFPPPVCVPETYTYTDGLGVEQQGFDENNIISDNVVYVSVTGLTEGRNDTGDVVQVESLPSDPVKVDLTDGNAINIYFPLVPQTRTHFDYYNVYAGTTPNNLVLQNNDLIPHSIDPSGSVNRYQHKKIDLVKLLKTGNAPPKAEGIEKIGVEKLLPFFQIYVYETRVELMQNEIRQDVWDTKIELITQTRGNLILPKNYAPINHLTIRAFVDEEMVSGPEYPEEVDRPIQLAFSL